jgi:hypothetical protein
MFELALSGATLAYLFLVRVGINGSEPGFHVGHRLKVGNETGINDIGLYDFGSI